MLHFLLILGVASLQDKLSQQGSLSNAKPYHPQSIESQMEQVASSPFAKMVFSLQTASLALNQPLNNLDEAVQNMLSDLSDDMEELKQDYLQREGQHKRVVDQLTMAIGDAQIEISNSYDMANTYRQEEEQLKKKLDMLGDNIKQNEQSVQREQISRKEDQQLNSNKIEDHKNCFSTIDLLLDFIQEMINSDLGLPEDEVDKRLENISIKLQMNSPNYPMIQALLETLSNVENVKQLKKIRGKLNKLRNQVQMSFNQDIFHERVAAAMFEKRMSQLDKEASLFKAQLNEALQTLTNIKLKIEQETTFQENRAFDIENYQEELELENDTFASESVIYLDMTRQYQEELDKAQEAIDLVKSNGFEDLVRKKLDVRFSKMK